MNQSVAQVIELLKEMQTPEGLRLDPEQTHRLIQFLKRAGEMIEQQYELIKKITEQGDSENSP